MGTWVMGLLLLAVMIELMLDLSTERGGPLKRVCAQLSALLISSKKLQGFCSCIAPFGLFAMVSLIWLWQFPTELLIDGAVEPYDEYSYAAGPMAEGSSLFEALRLKLSVMLIHTENVMRVIESAVQPAFVVFNHGMHWLFGVVFADLRVSLLVLLAWIVIEVVTFRALKIRGPLLYTLKYLFTSDPKLTSFEQHVFPNIFFLLVGVVYFSEAFAQTEENPRQKVWPLASAWLSAFRRLGVEADTLWVDSGWTAFRFFAALLLIMLAIPIGVAMARFARIDLLFHRFTLWGADKVNAFAIVILVFAILKGGEHTRIMLAVMALGPSAALDAFFRASEVPPRLVQKIKTFGATDMEVAFRRVLHLIFPGVINTIRLSIKSVIGILIFSETMGGNTGLGLRIGLAQRNNAIDSVIVMNGIFIMGLIAVDLALGFWVARGFRWFSNGRKK